MKYDQRRRILEYKESKLAQVVAGERAVECSTREGLTEARKCEVFCVQYVVCWCVDFDVVLVV